MTNYFFTVTIYFFTMTNNFFTMTFFKIKQGKAKK